MASETSKGHKKHADIKRPTLGQYGRYEIGLIGAPCGMIKNMVDDLAASLREEISITYLDADHQEGERPLYTRATDHISHDGMVMAGQLNDFDRRIAFTSSDLLLINSNHFLSAQQIVFCTEKKKDSLHRKLDRLTDIRLIILDEGIESPHDFLKDRLEGVPIFKAHEHDKISTWLRDYYRSMRPTIKGLVLAGGKSQRMGTPKELLDYHGAPQVVHASSILRAAGMEVYISCRDKEQALAHQEHDVIVDTFHGLGPYGAILSAMREDPDSAWCVIACDQPLLHTSHISHLIEHRDTSKLATCYFNPETGWPEPLITIWEPKAYQRLLSFLSLGYSCPRKVLINSEVHVVEVDDTTFMKNANTPEEREALITHLKT